jgi:signal transduction histidine kinase
MVFGEALVFILIIIIGAYYVIRTYYKEMDLAKKEKNFSLSVTHELKTPIASSKLFAQTLLEREDLSYEQQKTSLEKIIQEQNRLNDLVEKILLVSSIEEIKSDLNIKPISIGMLIDQLIENHNSTHLITNDVPKEVIIQADDFYIISLIQNLLDNAIKYSDTGSEIIFSSLQNSQEFILSVADQGVGIPLPYRTKIFERFYRIEDEEIRSSKGTGLGLFLVNEIVKIHGGKIKCRDNSPKGTVFDINFKTNYG